MNDQLHDFDRLLLFVFAVLLLKVSWKLYAPRLRRIWENAKTLYGAEIASHLLFS